MTIEISISTSKATELVNITTEIQRQVTKTGLKEGLVLIYVPHTTAGVTINEGADPSVKADIIDTINEIVPWERVYGHAEGNSPAHIKSTIAGSSTSLILEDGRLLLGQWQSIFFCEFDGPRRRQVLIKILPG
ncbi:MAG: secondary thiamine-phosphate synthase enzyme YjbQ [Thermodesulfobacteriota bacterium]|nr:secondary thiamine-phosphate synthase enzyme YjbQ [Thermodesulfobacteriota bacterium]